MEPKPNIARLIDKKELELKQLKRLLAQLPTLRITVGLSEKSLKEIEKRINRDISQCEMIIRDYRQ